MSFVFDMKLIDKDGEIFYNQFNYQFITRRYQNPYKINMLQNHSFKNKGKYMMIKNWFRFLFASLFTLIFLTGCIKVDEEIWLQEDGSGKMQITLGISEQALAFANDDAEKKLGDIFPSMSDIEGNPYVKNYQTKEYFQDGFKYVSFSVDITNVEKLLGDQEGKEITISKLKNGNLLFKQELNFENKGNNDSFSTEILHAALSGYYWRCVVHVKNVVNTNGILNKEAGTVEWNIPISDVISGESVVMTIEYKRPIPWYFYLFVVLAGVVVVVIVAFLAIKRKQSLDKSANNAGKEESFS